MDQQALLIVMTIFVIVAAIALLIQAGLLFAIFKSARTMEQQTQRLIPKVDAILPKVESMLPKIEALVESSKAAIDTSRLEIQEIAVRGNDILDVTRKQLERVDNLLEDVTGRARIQLDRAEMVLDDAMTRTQETVALVHHGIIAPLRQIEGIRAGVQAALKYLMNGRGRYNPSRTAVDEEMFI